MYCYLFQLDYSVNTVEEIDELKRNKNILDFSRGNVLKISGYFNRRWIKAELVSANSLILDNKIRDELDDLDEEQEDEEATKIIPNFYMSQVIICTSGKRAFFSTSWAYSKKFFKAPLRLPFTSRALTFSNKEKLHLGFCLNFIKPQINK